MVVFALDSSTASASVAIRKDDRTLFSFTKDYGTTHSEKLMPLCDEAFKTCCIKPDEVDVYVVCNGPGSYTGLRIGVSIIKGLAMSTRLPCVAVNTLEVLASAQRDGDVLALINARRGNHFCAGYRIKDGFAAELVSPRHAPTAEILTFFDGDEILVAGDGAMPFFDSLSDEQKGRYILSGNDMPSAETAAILGERVFNHSGGKNASDLLPAYIQPVHIG